MKFRVGDLVTPNPDRGHTPIGAITIGKDYIVERVSAPRADGHYYVHIPNDNGVIDAWLSHCFVSSTPQMSPDFELEEIHQAQTIYEKINGN